MFGLFQEMSPPLIIPTPKQYGTPQPTSFHSKLDPYLIFHGEILHIVTHNNRKRRYGQQGLIDKVKPYPIW